MAAGVIPAGGSKILRDILTLTQTQYDVVIIGGGIYGAALTWEAALRGLSVALVEKGDFGGGTSAHSLKTIHGGLRYLQSGDIKRMRQSSYERTTLMRIAPHLVHPLPCIVPTYGHGMRSREVMTMAMMMNDTITFDRNRHMARDKHIPRGQMLGKDEVQSLLPGIEERGLTGGALYYDAQVYNSERLTLAFIHSAAKIGADVVNYAQVTGFLGDEHQVTGIKVLDHLTGDSFDIRAKLVINTAGAWTGWVQRLLGRKPYVEKVELAKAVNIVTCPLFDRYAVGISDPGDGSRLYFVSPWRKHSMIGTTYSYYNDDPDQLSATERDVHNLLTVINRAYPRARLQLRDVTFVHRGLLPIKGVNRDGSVNLLKHPRIVDYREEGVSGLLSVEGVKYTTARNVAQHVIDRVFNIWEKTPSPSVSVSTPLYGGQIEAFDRYAREALDNNPWGINDNILCELIHNYGSAYMKVLEHLDGTVKEPQSADVLKAKILHAIRKEMAVKLSDVVFRRTDIATVSQPDPQTLKFCAEVMREELGWTDERTSKEIREVNEQFAWKG